MAPLVTVLLLTYRHENFIAEAIRGVLSQTYRPLEIIILDDASPDATPEVIAAELARHPEQTDVRVIRNPRNLGFRDNTVRGSNRPAWSGHSISPLSSQPSDNLA